MQLFVLPCMRGGGGGLHLQLRSSFASDVLSYTTALLRYPPPMHVQELHTWPAALSALSVMEASTVLWLQVPGAC